MAKNAADLLMKFNKAWAKRVSNQKPGFFHDLSKDQHPAFLWVGCSDSRVPVNIIVEQCPGDIFVHRNIANLVSHADINCQSVIQYAVQVLHVEHIIICGHYGCGGIAAAMGSSHPGPIDNWLEGVRELYHIHSEEIGAIVSETDRVNRLSELNVQLQVQHICENPYVKEQWAANKELWIHGWMYDLETGLLKDLNPSLSM